MKYNFHGSQSALLLEIEMKNQCQVLERSTDIALSKKIMYTGRNR